MRRHHPVKQVSQSERGADLHFTPAGESNGDGGGGFGPGRHRVGDGRQRLNRATAELARVPGVDRGLVARLPRHLRPPFVQPRGGLVIVDSAQIMHVLVGDIDVAHLVG